MHAANTLNPPIEYDIIWLIIGLILFLSIVIWYATIFWVTRRRPINSIDNLKDLPVGAELDRLKAKYLRLIDEWYQQFANGQIDLRKLHLELSLLARFFVFEAKHFPAPVLTLGDLMRGPYGALTKVIAWYYPKEFAAISSGEAEKSVAAAKEFVQQWT